MASILVIRGNKISELFKIQFSFSYELYNPEESFLVNIFYEFLSGEFEMNIPENIIIPESTEENLPMYINKEMKRYLTSNENVKKIFLDSSTGEYQKDPSTGNLIYEEMLMNYFNENEIIILS